MPRIFLLEDDPLLGKHLKIMLELEGYSVDWCQSLATARKKKWEQLPDLHIVDWGLPDGIGTDWVKSLREGGDDSPVIFLAARHDEDAVVTALEIGAKDYIRKPFGQKELLARIKTSLNESHKVEDKIRYKDLVLDKASRKASFGDTRLELSPTEFDVLQLLVHKAESVVPREALIALFGDESDALDRTLDSHISHIRKKLKAAGAVDCVISSVYGVGYRLETKA